MTKEINLYSIEPDQFWDNDDPETSYESAKDFAFSLADSFLPCEEKVIFAEVLCSKKLPTRKMKLVIGGGKNNCNVDWSWQD